MIGIIFIIIGIVTTLMSFSLNTALGVFSLVVSLYNASSYNEMTKENRGIQPTDKFQTLISLVTSVLLIILFIYTLVSV
jgi:hypothetical protein